MKTARNLTTRIAILSAGLLFLHCATLSAKAPGKIGVYCNLRGVSTSTEQLRRVMRQMKASGVDFVLPYTKETNGQVFWKSEVAPPALVRNAEFLGRVTEEAHRAGLKVHPVICVATEGGEATTNTVLQQNPGWAYVVKGERVGYIDPGNAAAREYEIRLMVELVSKYKVDGLSLDYMRCPNRVGYTDTGRKEFLAKYGVDLAKVTSGKSARLDTEGGKKAAPTTATVDARKDPIWPKWREWRREQLNAFMRQLHAAVRKARPGLPISSYCWGAHTYTGNFETAQDWKTWISEGLLDWINPSGYRYTDEAFRQAAELNRRSVPEGFPYYITIGVHTSHGTLPDIAALRRQMEMSKQAGADGLVFFTWESLSKFLPEAAADIKAWSPAGKRHKVSH